MKVKYIITQRFSTAEKIQVLSKSYQNLSLIDLLKFQKLNLLYYTLCLYKQHFYKQRQAEISKNLSKN